MIITTQEITKTSIYPEILQRITRGDGESAEMAILSAQELAKSYLFRYDCNAIFGVDFAPPTFHSEIIKQLTKMIAVYYILRRANTTIDIELARADYEDALKILADIRDGKNNPALPYAQDNPDTPQDESHPPISFYSNPKRTQHF